VPRNLETGKLLPFPVLGAPRASLFLSLSFLFGGTRLALLSPLGRCAQSCHFHNPGINDGGGGRAAHSRAGVRIYSL
jgi:hypothetical protein